MDSTVVSAPSCAKINLFLHITQKRADNFHDLQTWFQFIDLKDQLTFKTNKNTFEIMIQSNQHISNNDENLVFKAAQTLKPFATKPCGLDIFIDKHIPMGAGLGGGSSNAATTLVVLNEIWQCHLDQSKLLKLGKSIGADVPIFIFAKSAWAEGVGDKLIEKAYTEQYALIIKPPFHASTAQLFNHPLLNKNATFIDHTRISSPEHLDNAFQSIIMSTQPMLQQLFEQLPDHDQLKLTGTGACFFPIKFRY